MSGKKQGMVHMTFLAPVKSLPQIATPNKGLVFDPGVGIVGNRTYAIYDGLDSPRKWVDKNKCVAGINTPGMYPGVGVTEYELDENFALSNGCLRAMLAASPFNPDAMSIIRTDGTWQMTDTPGPYISVMNLESVRVLHDKMRAEGAPEGNETLLEFAARFRADIIVSGWSAFHELSIDHNNYPDNYPIFFGNELCGVADVTVRCGAVEQSTVTGVVSKGRVLRALGECLWECSYKGAPPKHPDAPRRPKFVMGFYVTSHAAFTIRVGQEVTFMF